MFWNFQNNVLMESMENYDNRKYPDNVLLNVLIRPRLDAKFLPCQI